MFICVTGETSLSVLRDTFVDICFQSRVTERRQSKLSGRIQRSKGLEFFKANLLSQFGVDKMENALKLFIEKIQ